MNNSSPFVSGRGGGGGAFNNKKIKPVIGIRLVYKDKTIF